MKRLSYAFGIFLCISFILTACGSQGGESSNSSMALTQENSCSEAENSPLSINDIELIMELQEPDKYGNSYIDYTYTNSTNQTITSLTLTIHYLDTNKTGTVYFNQTVLPGETSPIEEELLDEPKKLEDIEVTEYQFIVAAENEQGTYLTYDCKTNQYSSYTTYNK